MLLDAVRFLACPHCGDALGGGERSVRCHEGHVFDISRYGYVALFSGSGRTHDGDDGGMVAARNVFLGAGHYDWIAEALSERAAGGSTSGPGCVVDVGTGTGYYLAAVLDALPERVGIGLDVSGYALRRAVKAHPRAAAVACDVWHGIPVQDGAVAVAINLFSPRNGPELYRILRPDGKLLVVTPASHHLAELRAVLPIVQVDEKKEERVARALEPHLRLEDEVELERRLSLDRADVAALVGMGPTARHLEPEGLQEALEGVPDPIEVTASVRLCTYRRPEKA